MGPFNNREIAIAFWLLALAVCGLRKPDIRNSLGGVVRAFCDLKVLAAVCLMLLYVAVIVASFAAIGIWKVDLLKDTIVWFFVGAMAMMVRFNTADNKDNVFRKILTDSIKIIIFLEFLVNTYTFPLIVELIIVPLLTSIAMIDAVATRNEEHALVAKLAKRVQTVIGFVIIGIAIYRAVTDFQNLKSVDTFRSIVLAPLLSVLMFPFIYIMLVFSQYELVFLRLDFGAEKTRQLKRYARRHIMIYAGLSLKRLRYLLKNYLVDLMHIGTESDIDRFLQQARNADTSATEIRQGETGQDDGQVR